MPQTNNNELRQGEQNVTHQPTIAHQEITQQLYQGPIPHPDILKGFKDVDASFPERIMKMAEKHADASIREQDRISRSNAIVPIIGQFFTLLLGILGVGSGVFLALKGFGAASIAAIIGGFAPIVIAAINNLGKK